MTNVKYCFTSQDEDLIGILQLQERNLAKNLSPDEILSQGFVTVSHDLGVLQKMTDIEPSIFAKGDQKIIGYVLAMTPATKEDIPILQPMFEIFEELEYKKRLLRSYDYIVIGQVCIDKDYRGKGVLKELYKKYGTHFQDRYELAITEIASKNLRSLHAHQHLGFKTIHSYTAPDGEKWKIVLWDWSVD